MILMNGENCKIGILWILRKYFPPTIRVYIRIVGGKYFFFHILIIGSALKTFPYRNKDALPKSAPFYKKRALACKRHLFKIGALS
jgi:hypothetical protein